MRDLMLDSLSQVLAGTHSLGIKENFHRLDGRLLLVIEAYVQVQTQMQLLVD